MSALDKAVVTDLAALGSEGRQHPLDIEATLRATGAYPDGRPTNTQRESGNEALLVAMANVFALRIARAAAGSAAVSCTISFIIRFSLPIDATWGWEHYTLTMPLVCLAIGASVLGVHAIARRIAELVFERRLLRATETSSAMEVGRRLVRRTDGNAVAMWTLGITSLVTVVTVMLLVVGTNWSHAWERARDDRPSDYIGNRISATWERGTMAHDRGEHELALAAFREVSKLAPDFREAHVRAAVELSALHRTSEALVELARYAQGETAAERNRRELVDRFRVDEPALAWFVPARSLHFIAVMIAIGLAAALAIGRACGREHRRGRPSRWLRRLGHPMVVLGAVTLGLGTLLVGFKYDAGQTSVWLSETPSQPFRLALTITGTTAVFLLATSFALWRRRRENARIGLSAMPVDG